MLSLMHAVFVVVADPFVEHIFNWCFSPLQFDNDEEINHVCGLHRGGGQACPPPWQGKLVLEEDEDEHDGIEEEEDRLIFLLVSEEENDLVYDEKYESLSTMSDGGGWEGRHGVVRTLDLEGEDRLGVLPLQ